MGAIERVARVFGTVVQDSVAFALLIAGAFYGVGWAYNVVLFMVWVMSITYTATILLPDCLESQAAKMVSKPYSKLFLTNPYLKWYDRVTDAAFLLLMAAAGWFVTAAAFVVMMSAKELIKDKITTTTKE